MGISRVNDNVTLWFDSLWFDSLWVLFPHRDEVKACLSCVEFVIEAQDVKGSLLNSLKCLFDGLTLKEDEVEVQFLLGKKTRHTDLYEIML